MKAAQIQSYGGKEVLKVNDDAPRPSADEGQVLVDVSAAGVNPFDVKVRDGMYPLPDTVKLPGTLGGDVAGVIVELGEGVTEFEIGQEVYGQAGAMSGQGSFAEFTPVKASQLAFKPNKADFLTAAALPLVATSAYQALVDHMNLQAGQKFLIHGGAGGIGSIAIQLAKHLGAYVATTVQSDDIEFVQDLGADEVIDYEAQDFTEIIKDYDAVFDTVGGETNEKSYDVLKPRGILVSMVAPPNDELVTSHGISYVSQFTQATTERLSKITELVDQSILKINVDKVFPLDEAAEALEYLKTGHPRGKVVIQVK